MRWVLIFIFVIYVSVSSAQSQAEEDKAFMTHLIENRLYGEGLIIGKKALLNNYPSKQKDSLTYALAVCEYFYKNFDTSVLLSTTVKDEGLVGDQARTLAVFQRLYQRKPADALTLIREYNYSDSVYKEMSVVHYASALLLQKDFKGYDSVKKSFTYKNYLLERCENSLDKHSTELKNMKLKSPALAATISAFLPGIGKVYAGKPGEGISMFFMCAALGVQAWDGYRHNGFKDPYFYLYSGLFSLFYAGNIVGSYNAARMYNKEKNNAIYSNILFDLHIPLRSLLNI